MAALGRGLDSLIAKGEGSPQPEDQSEVVISKIRPNPNQPRKVFDSSHLEDLRSSIENHGILQPICVRRVEGGFEIISGERRWRAARLAGMRTIPVVIRDEVDNDQMMELALVENLQRQDLDPIEKARGFQEMIAALNITQEEVAAKVGLKRSTVTNHLRLLDLDPEVQEALVSGLITMGHARALLSIDGTPKVKKQALAQIVRDELSVRQTEKLVRESGRGSVAKADKPESGPSTSPRRESWITEIENRIREELGTRVELTSRAGYRGQLTIQFSGREELDRLVDKLAPKKTI